MQRHLLIAAVLCACIHPAAHAQATLHNYLPADHWGRGALHRLAALGAVDAAVPMRAWPLSRADLRGLLEAARASAVARGDSATLRIADGFLAQVVRESRTMQSRILRGGVFARMEPYVYAWSGELRAGTMEQNPDGTYRYPGPLRISDRRGYSLEQEIAVKLGKSVTLGAQGEGLAGGPTLSAAYIHARGRRLGVWAGRRSFTFGAAAHGLVLAGGNPFDGVGVSLVEGVSVPLVGAIYGDVIFARFGRSGEVLHPYFHASRLVLAPRPNVAIGLSRAMILGGEGNEAITPWRVLLAAIGLTDVAGKDSDFENQVASIDVSWQVPDTRVRVYAEVGAEDSGLAFWFVPGIIAGAELSRPGDLEELAVGLEVVHIHERCCTYPPWYQHGALGDGWTYQGQLLGHPLGGAGTQVALNVRFDRGAGVIASGQAFARERKPENLLAPTHGGRSLGGRVNLTIRAEPFDVILRAQGESGRGWATGRIHGGLALTF